MALPVSNPKPRSAGPFDQLWKIEVEYAAPSVDGDNFYWQSIDVHVINRTGTLHGLPDLSAMADAAIAQAYRERSIVENTAHVVACERLGEAVYLTHDPESPDEAPDRPDGRNRRHRNDPPAP